MPKVTSVKRKLTKKYLAKKCKALKGLEKKVSNKDVAAKYSVPRNTVLTWVKSKPKLTAILAKKGINSSRKSTHRGNYEKVDKTVYNWFIDKKAKNTNRRCHDKRESPRIL